MSGITSDTPITISAHDLEAKYVSRQAYDELRKKLNDLQLELDRAADFHPRAMKLIRKRRNFVVVAENEPYFMAVYDLIRAFEKAKSTWFYGDEEVYQIVKRRVLANIADAA